MRIYTILLSVFLSPVLSRHEHRTVNLALETSLLLEPKDAHAHLGVVNNIRTFLDKVTELLEPHVAFNDLSYRQNDDGNNILLYVLKGFGNSMLNYTNERIESVAHAIKNRLQQHASEVSSPFHEVLSNPKLKKLLRNSIHQFSNTDGEQIKSLINMFLNTDNPVLRTVTRRLNRFYTAEDIDKFNEFIYKFNEHNHKKEDASKIIIDWLDYSIFDHYNKLNETSKKRLLNDITIFTNYLSDNNEYPSNDLYNSTKLKRRNSLVNLHDDANFKDNKNPHTHIFKVIDTDNDTLKLSNEYINDETGKRSMIRNKNGNTKTELIIDNVEFIVKPVINQK